MKVATDAALEHFRASKAIFEKNGGNLQPPSSYLVYYFELFKLAEKEKLTIEAVVAMNEKNPKLANALVNRE